MYTINLSWKNFNVNLSAVNNWLKDNAGESFCGTSANSVLQVHFSQEPSEQIKDAISSYWDGMMNMSTEATSYKSKAEIEQEVIAKRASARVKLLTLGLTDEEIDALKL